MTEQELRDIKNDIEKFKMKLEKKESYLKQTGIPTKNVLTADEINNIGEKFDGLIEYIANLYDNFPNEEERKKIIKAVEDNFSAEFKGLLDGLKKYEERLKEIENELKNKTERFHEGSLQTVLNNDDFMNDFKKGLITINGGSIELNINKLFVINSYQNSRWIYYGINKYDSAVTDDGDVKLFKIKYNKYFNTNDKLQFYFSRCIYKDNLILLKDIQHTEHFLLTNTDDSDGRTWSNVMFSEISIGTQLILKQKNSKQLGVESNNFTNINISFTYLSGKEYFE